MRFVIETDKSTDEVIGIIKNNTHLDIPLYRVIYDDNVTKKYFRGEVSGSSFKVQRCVRGQFGYVPLVFGNCTETNSGTKVEIEVRLRKLIAGFSVLWLTGVALMCVLVVIVAAPLPESLVPYGMLLFGLFCFVMYPHYEAKKALRTLQELLA